MLNLMVTHTSCTICGIFGSSDGFIDRNVTYRSVKNHDKVRSLVTCSRHKLLNFPLKASCPEIVIKIVSIKWKADRGEERSTQAVEFHWLFGP